MSEGRRVPRLGSEHLDRVCGKRIDEESEDICGKEAVIHIVWSRGAAGEITAMGYACEEHREKAIAEFVSVQHHWVGACCGMPGSRWFFGENLCRYENGLPTVEVDRRELVKP